MSRLPVCSSILRKDVACDLQQVAVQFPVFHALVNVAQFVVVQTKPSLHQVVSFGDQLHQAIFDPVVNHLDVMARRARAEPGDTRIVVHLCGHCFEYRAHAFVGLFRSAGHDAWAVTRTFFATRHSHTQEMDALRLQVVGADIRVLEVGVAGIDDQIALVQVRQTNP